MSSEYEEWERNDPGPVESLKVTLTEYADQQQKLEFEILGLEELLKEKKEELRGLSEQTIPNLMDGLQGKFSLDDGREVQVTEKIHSSVSERNRPSAMQWLKDNGHDGIIKNVMSIDLGKGREQEAAEILGWMSDNHPGCAVKVTKSVHHSTLGAFVRRQMEEGVDIPQETFGVFKKRSTKIKGETQ